MYEIELRISRDITKFETDKVDESFAKKMLDEHMMSLTGRYKGTRSGSDMASTRRGSISSCSSDIYTIFGTNINTRKYCEDENTISTSRSTVSSFSRVHSTGTNNFFSKVAGILS